MRIGISTFATDEGITPAALGRAMEERGFESLFLAEHSHIPVRRETPHPMGGDLPRGYYRPVDPFVALGAISSVTTTLRLGTGIALLIQRDVIQTAKEVATLDLISGGRAVFGAGVGWNREEMRNHGTDPRVRGALLDEQLDALRQIWTKDEAEFHGRYVDFDPIFQWPKPVQQPHPPIYVGGNGEPAVRRVAAHGDGWLPNAVREPDQVAGQLALLREYAGDDVPVTATSASAKRLDVLDAYAEAGVDRVTLGLPAVPEADTLRMLDRMAEVPARYR